MFPEPKRYFRITIGVAFFVLICCISFTSASDSNRTVDLNLTNGNQGNTVVAKNFNGTNTAQPGNIIAFHNIEESIDRQITQIEDYKKNQTKTQKKLSDNLLLLIDDKYPIKIQTHEQIKAQMKKAKQLIPAEEAASYLNIMQQSFNALNDQVKVEIYVKPSVTTQIVEPYVTKIIGRDEEWHLVVAWVDINNLESLASLDGVSVIRTVEPAEHSVGSVTTEGDSILRATNVRSIYNYAGNNVKVGIISDGVTNYANAVASQDLPANFDSSHILSSSNGYEGVPMGEVIHDITPGVELYFYKSDLTDPVSYDDAVDSLIDHGCSVIADDTLIFSQPFFEDGIIASHIKQKLTDNQNLVFVTAAGNYANRHYQGNFRDDGNHYHNFNPGSGSPVNNLSINIHSNDDITIYLQWNDKWGASANDYDLYLIDSSNGNILAACTREQPGYPDPVESIYYQNTAGTSKTIEIRVKNAGPGGIGQGAIKTLEMFIRGVGKGLTLFNSPTNNYLVPGDSIIGYQALPDVITVGTTSSGNLGGDINTIWYRSSNGPSSISYPSVESRQKPDIVGITDVSVSSAVGQEGGVTYSNGHYYFTGTSAAAPHIAGIVALAKEAKPSLTRSQIKNYLTSSAVHLGSPGWNPVYGYGRADALAMIQQILTVGPPLASFTSTPHAGTAPLTVRFTDTSTGNPVGWLWTFGDNSTINSTMQHPVHTYTANGTYSVSLWVIGAGGTNTTTRVNSICVGDCRDKVGIYRDGAWYLDNNGNRIYGAGDQNFAFGGAGWTPVIGDWASDGKSKGGVYKDGNWYLDYNGNGIWDAGDRNYGLGGVNWTAVTGDWNGAGSDKIGAYKDGAWYLDYDGSGTWTASDKNFAFGGAGWTPVVGKWTSGGKSRVGVYKDGVYYIDYSGDWAFGAGDKTVSYGATGSTAVIGDWNANGLTEVGTLTGSQWKLDYDGSGAINASTKSSTFGAAGWNPVIGDWNGDGKDKIGIYQDGAWYLDYNGNGVWEGGTDKNYAFGSPGWIPVIGFW